MGAVAVDVQGVSKRFRLYHEKYSSLKEKIIHAGRIPYEDLWALNDVSFDVMEGETVGILGRNGSGKSTLLKCVCGVLQPSAGQVVVRGKLAGLLELGAGFQMDLSGRENIYLNGSMLGLSRREVDRLFDDIVEFAELGQFIDNQVKFYSSGMYVRLGFAVAVNVDPDVLVIDEVLAVGDERFQRKCMDRIKHFQKEGRTILFVSHSPDMVRSICDRAVVLSDGKMIGMGSPGEAVRLFRERLMEAGDELSISGNDPAPAVLAEPGGPGPGPGTTGEEAVPTTSRPDTLGSAFAQPGSPAGAPTPSSSSGSALPGPPAPPDPPGRLVPPGPPASLPRQPAPVGGGRGGNEASEDQSRVRPVRFTEVQAVYPEADHRRYLLPGEPLLVRAGFNASAATDGVIFSIDVRLDDGSLLARTDTDVLGMTVDVPAGPGVMDFHMGAIPLLDGTYEIVVGAHGEGGVLYDWKEPACRFEVMNPGRSTGVIALTVRAELHAGEMITAGAVVGSDVPA